MTNVCAIILSLMAIAILPSQNRDRAATTRIVRADEPRSLENVKPLDPGAAGRALDGRTRLAVLPLAVSGDDPAVKAEGLGCMQAMTDDLRYVPAYIVSDRYEVDAALGNAAEMVPPVERALAELTPIARSLGVRLLIDGTLAAKGADRLTLTARLVEVGDDGATKVVAEANAERPRAEIYELTDDALLALLNAAGTTPEASRIAEMGVVPTKSFAARVAYDEGLADMHRADTAAKDRKPLVDAALAKAVAAIKADGAFLPAHLLKGSCEAALGHRDALARTLTNARRGLRTMEVDSLTRLELDGDYASFVKPDLDKAVSAYASMLEIDPASTRALWSLVSVYSGMYGWEDRTKEDAFFNHAGTYAAQLIAAHPKSPLAAYFTAKPVKSEG